MNKTRVLLVDDHHEVAKMVRQIFEMYQKRRGQPLDFVFVETGQAAVEMVQAGRRFDLILMDYQIPPGNDGGLWATKEIKAIDPAVPIIFLSAYTARENLKRAEATGAIGYIAKTIFTQMPVVKSLLDRDWNALQRYVDAKEVWLFEKNILRIANSE